MLKTLTELATDYGNRVNEKNNFKVVKVHGITQKVLQIGKRGSHKNAEVVTHIVV